VLDCCPRHEHEPDLSPLFERSCRDLAANQFGVTTRKCANCPVREAAAMLARSAIRGETQFSSCPKAAKPTVFRKALFRDRNQTIKRTLFTLERRPDAPTRCLPLAQSTRINAQRLKLSKFGSLEPHNSDTCRDPLISSMACTTPEQGGSRPVRWRGPTPKSAWIWGVLPPGGSEISLSPSLKYPGKCANPWGHFRLQRSRVLS
jgi:hypothetical protein